MSFASEKESRNLAKRHRKARLFAGFCAAVTWSGVLLLAVLLYEVSVDGFKWLDWQFISSFPSRFPERAGIKSALMAERGITGERDPLESRTGLYHTYMGDDYDINILTNELGKRFEGVNIGDKPYPCCGLAR